MGRDITLKGRGGEWGKKTAISATQHKMHTRVFFFIKNNQLKFVNPSVTESLNSIETLKVALLEDAPTKLHSHHRERLIWLTTTNLNIYRRIVRNGFVKDFN